MKIFDRRRTALQAPRGSYADAGEITHVSIHHGGRIGRPPMTFLAGARRWREFQQWHFDRGWDDVGYHLGIDGRGRGYIGRPVGKLPAAVIKHNEGMIAIVFMRDGALGPNRFERGALEELFEKGVPRLNIPPLKTFARHPGQEWGVFGHREYSGHESNECPGNRLFRELVKTRSR